MTEFVHAYNFVQFGERSTDDDHEPPSHGQYGPELLYGRIDVTFKTVTPLLVPDRSTDTVDDGHRTSRTRTFGGRPVIPATGIKGALRAAHEAVTSSRLGVPTADKRLGYRMQASEARGVIPARVEKCDTHGSLCLVHLEAVRVSEEWLGQMQEELSLEHHLDLHGLEVEARLRQGRPPRIESICPAREGAAPRQGWKQGWLLVTGRKAADNKRYERFVYKPANPTCTALNDEMIKSWTEVIQSYLDEHSLADGEVLADEENDGVRPSAHLLRSDRRDLVEGSIVYLVKAPNLKEAQKKVNYRPIPVPISRGIFVDAPIDLVPKHARPLQGHQEASPTDRLFGYTVPGKSSTSHRGHVRIVSVDTSATAVETIDAGLTLAPLSSPKPSQYRFYLAGKDDRSPGGISRLEAKDAYRRGGQVLRGRKFYVHHQNHELSAAAKTNQNLTMRDFIAADRTFEVSFEVDGVHPRDLVALMWLLGREVNGGAHLRLGYGKPLGFGSVIAEKVQLSAWTGEEARSAASEFRRPRAQFDSWRLKTSESDGKTTLMMVLRNACDSEDQGEGHQHVVDVEVWADLLREFEAIMRGADCPVTYPFVIDGHGVHHSGEEGFEGYQWFIENAKSSAPQVLPAPWETMTALRKPEKEADPNKRGGGGGARGGGKPGGGKPGGGGARGGGKPGGGKPGGGGARGGGKPGGGKPGGGGARGGGKSGGGKPGGGGARGGGKSGGGKPGGGGARGGQRPGGGKPGGGKPGGGKPGVSR